MTLLLTPDEVVELATDDVALEAVRRGFEAEARGATALPVRLDAPSPTGFFRTMPAVLGGRMGCKIMTLVRGQGTRYLVLLYSVETGELLALVDADELTKIRTAATTALAAQHLCSRPMQRLAVIGSGFEAKGHLAFFARQWKLDEVRVHSRSAENRKAFASDMSEQTGLDIHDAGSLEEAVTGADTVLLATKSPAPVIDGTLIEPGTVVLSIGSTRPDLRELDHHTFSRASVLVVDALEQVMKDSGDVIEALRDGHLEQHRIRPLAEFISGQAAVEAAAGPGDLTVFKSAGTALQDLALADAILERAQSLGRGIELGDVSRLKPFNGKG